MRVSFQVVEGVDKGRTFLNLETPVTLGREEGNTIRLNDERVSRFHAKVQEDNIQVVLTDLDSTNGTLVNGEPVQLRLLRPGDRVVMGRSVLIFGTPEEIAARYREDALSSDVTPTPGEVTSVANDEKTVNLKKGDLVTGVYSDPGTSDLVEGVGNSDDVFQRTPPQLPIRLSPAQAAQLSEVIDYLHRTLAHAIDPVRIPDESKEALLPIASWQRVQNVLALLARYSRQVAEPSDV